MNREDSEGILFGVGLFGLLLAAVIIVSVVGFAYWWVFSPLQVQRETQNAHQSYGYTTTQQNNLLDLLADYNKLQQQIDTLSGDGQNEAQTITDLRAEQNADVNRMKNNVALMDPTQVPPLVSQFLAGK